MQLLQIHCEIIHRVSTWSQYRLSSSTNQSMARDPESGLGGNGRLDDEQTTSLVLHAVKHEV